MRPVSSRRWYENPMTAHATTNSANDSGMLRSFMSSLAFEAESRSISRARMTTPEFETMVTAKIARKHTSVLASAPVENTNANPGTSAPKNEAVTCMSNCESPTPSAMPTASDTAPIMPVSRATKRASCPRCMPSVKYTANSRLRRRMRNRSAYTTRNARITATNTDTPPMSMPSRSSSPLLWPSNAKTACWSVMELNA